MICNTQDYWGFWTLSIVWYSINTKEHNFQKLERFPPSSEEQETPTLLGPVERADLNRITLLYKHLRSGLVSGREQGNVQ
jgi:hypothetical protein